VGRALPVSFFLAECPSILFFFSGAGEKKNVLGSLDRFYNLDISDWVVGRHSQLANYLRLFVTMEGFGTFCCTKVFFITTGLKKNRLFSFFFFSCVAYYACVNGALSPPLNPIDILI
jgi:hypothetical protein